MLSAEKQNVQKSGSQISTDLPTSVLTIRNDERWDATKTFEPNSWYISFQYPDDLQMDPGDAGSYFSSKEAFQPNTFFDRLIALPSQLDEDEFYFGYAFMGDGMESGQPILDLSAYILSIETNLDATYDRVLIGPYEGVREVTSDRETIYVRTGLSTVWYFSVTPADEKRREIFESIISTLKIDS